MTRIIIRVPKMRFSTADALEVPLILFLLAWALMALSDIDEPPPNPGPAVPTHEAAPGCPTAPGGAP